MKKLLLVTGSRALADGSRSDAESWAKNILRTAMAGMDSRDVLLSGGATGPDYWAAQESRSRGIRTIELKLDGKRYDNDKIVGEWFDPKTAGRFSAQTWPLERNRVLIDSAVKSRDAGWKVTVLALVAPWSKTKGTGHTLLHAGLNGLLTEEHIFEEAKFTPPAATPMIEIETPDVIWLDLETGGTSNRAPIIEIGAIRTDSSSRIIRDVFETKLQVPAGMFVDPGAAAINGYDEELWSSAPLEPVGLKAFLEWLPKNHFAGAGYNHPFDRRFVHLGCSRYGLPKPLWEKHLPIDPLHKIRQLLKNRGKIQDAKLDTACDHLGIYNEVRHRALADAERARLVFLKLLGMSPEKSIFDSAQGAA